MDNTVELLGIYGSDLTHACSAWTSTSRELTEEKVARVPKLIQMLADNKHGTPFEKSSLHFLVTTDIATHIHILKHRIAVSVNGESARYREFIEDKYYVPIDWPEELKELIINHSDECFRLYHHVLDLLVNKGFSRKRAKESARYFLPYATQLTADVMFNFRSFVHFQGLRNEDHAQEEVHWVAEEMRRLIQEEGSFEYSLKAFNLYK